MTLARFDTFVRSPIGPAAAGSQIYLCSQPAVTSNVPPNPLIQLYADPAGSTLIAQPIVADGFGHAYGYCVAGTYTVVVVLGGRVQQVYPDQAIGVATGGSGVFPQTIVPPASQWVNGYNSTTGIFSAAQPAVSDINGLAAQLALKAPLASTVQVAVINITNDQLIAAGNGSLGGGTYGVPVNLVGGVSGKVIYPVFATFSYIPITQGFDSSGAVDLHVGFNTTSITSNSGLFITDGDTSCGIASGSPNIELMQVQSIPIDLNLLVSQPLQFVCANGSWGSTGDGSAQIIVGYVIQ